MYRTAFFSSESAKMTLFSSYVKSLPFPIVELALQLGKVHSAQGNTLHINSNPSGYLLDATIISLHCPNSISCEIIVPNYFFIQIILVMDSTLTFTCLIYPSPTSNCAPRRTWGFASAIDGYSTITVCP